MQLQQLKDAHPAARRASRAWRSSWRAGWAGNCASRRPCCARRRASPPQPAQSPAASRRPWLLVHGPPCAAAVRLVAGACTGDFKPCLLSCRRSCCAVHRLGVESGRWLCREWARVGMGKVGRRMESHLALVRSCLLQPCGNVVCDCSEVLRMCRDGYCHWLWSWMALAQRARSAMLAVVLRETWGFHASHRGDPNPHQVLRQRGQAQNCV